MINSFAVFILSCDQLRKVPMGKRKLEFIKCDKKRKSAFERLSKSLKKKAYQLATSHNVAVCVIINPGPNSEAVETFPENREEVRALTDRYMEARSRSARNLDLQEDKDRRMKMKNLEIETNSVLDKCSREELSVLASRLDYKIQCIDERLRFLKAQSLDASLAQNAEFDGEKAVPATESKPASGVLAERLGYLKTQSVDASLAQNAEFHGEKAVPDTESKPASGVLATYE